MALFREDTMIFWALIAIAVIAAMWLTWLALLKLFPPIR